MPRLPLYELALTIPWCITSDALEAMLSIAAHTPLSEGEIAQRMHGSNAPEALAFRERTKRDDSRQLEMRDGVALLPIDGPIYRYADMFTAVSGGITTEALAKDIQRAMDDPNVVALLLVIDSPGGESTGISELADMIYANRATKPIGAYGEGMIASAAYWIASATEVIGVEPTTWVGSIGTVVGVPDPTKRPSTTIQFVSDDAPKKRPDPTTEAGRSYIQSLANRTNRVFVEAVMRNRGMTRDAVLAVEGGVHVGSDAIDSGLVDRLASEEEMIAVMRQRAQERQTSRSVGLSFATGRKHIMGADKKGFWAEFFGAAREQGLIDDQAQPESRSAQPPASNAAHQAEVDRLRQQLAQAHTTEANAFAEQLITSNQALPAERDALQQLYTQAAADDLAHGALMLANGTQTSRVALVKTAHAQRAKHTLTKEQLLNGQNAAVLLNKTETPTEQQTDLDDAEKSARDYAARANGRQK